MQFRHDVCPAFHAGMMVASPRIYKERHYLGSSSPLVWVSVQGTPISMAVSFGSRPLPHVPHATSSVDYGGHGNAVFEQLPKAGSAHPRSCETGRGEVDTT